MSNYILEIKNLTAEIPPEKRVDTVKPDQGGGKKILRGLDLKLAAGKVHAIMGPNGSGKSSLAYYLAGRNNDEITGGSVLYDGQDLLAMEPDARAQMGIFLAFQYPVEIPGVNSMVFLRAAFNAGRKARGEPILDAGQFLKIVRAQLKILGMGEEMLSRAVNVGFSGGEKKRHEILQMMVLQPKLAILDEIDSGLDIDALRQVGAAVNAMRSAGRTLVLITHYQRLLSFVEPDHVHILAGGRIVESGDRSLALALEQHGYAKYIEAAKV
ncbi:MAG: Fe-S cluster assembly ATPase SufC [Candidatus Symbiobacter sp.]|nr:Fe-S cluster assembly ATPase SufC [Candidatus Symbiobacter sp.]